MRPSSVTINGGRIPDLVFALFAKRGDERSVLQEHLDAVVARIGDIDLAVLINGQCLWIGEPSIEWEPVVIREKDVVAEGATPFEFVFPVCTVDLDPLVPGIQDKHGLAVDAGDDIKWVIEEIVTDTHNIGTSPRIDEVPVERVSYHPVIVKVHDDDVVVTIDGQGKVALPFHRHRYRGSQKTV